MIPQRIVPVRHGDARGWFTVSYNSKALVEHGIYCAFAQDNKNFSAQRGTLRGLHFQFPPEPLAKLVRCMARTIWDVPDFHIGGGVPALLLSVRGEA